MSVSSGTSASHATRCITNRWPSLKTPTRSAPETRFWENMSMSKARLGRIAILWRGDEAERHSATPETSRFKAVFAALADVGVDAEPVVYEDDSLNAVRAQLATLDGVLVWVNPIHEGRSRANLDALLREVTAH